ncbi:peroxidasin-like [Diaphorina citri]|uniref:Peroxidasin-like n=1 Tax=Diaphorina citri TaxID=121845 RepID=A0A3Q0IRA0_DIACI|nr:peroxidasin-like [Diaphorina citri]
MEWIIKLLHPLPSAKLRLMRTSGDVTTSVGSRIRLECQFEGYPAPSITWRKEDIVIANDDKFHIQTDDRRSSTELVISGVQREHGGRYSCVAGNPAGVYRGDLHVTVNAPPIFIQRPVSTTYSTGSTSRITCLVEGHPLPQMTWFHDGNSLDSDDHVTYEHDGFVLVLNGVRESDAGVYNCVAQNSEGSAESVAMIRINGHRAPRLVVKPFDMRAPAGSSVEIPCKPDGEPLPRISWSKDEAEFVEDRNHKIHRTGSLRLYNIGPQDSGLYRCTASNLLGEDVAEGYLTVTGENSVEPAPHTSREPSASKPSVADDTIHMAVKLASREVDAAVNATINSLFGYHSNEQQDHGSLMKLLRFPDESARTVVRAADVYERTLSHIKKHIQAGVKMNLSEGFSYHDVLSPRQIELIANLSGCMEHQRTANCSDLCFHTKYRTIDGTCNNLQHPMWGASLTGFRRLLKPIYENGFSTPVGWTKGLKYYGYEKPPARVVSNEDKLQRLYGHPGNIDPFVGAILEDQVDGGRVGPTMRCLLIDQFKRIRDGNIDPFVGAILEDQVDGGRVGPTMRCLLIDQFKRIRDGNIDPFVGAILEDQVDGGRVGPTMRCLLIDQFKRIRDGDRFWYENPSTFKPAQLTQIKQASLARVICDSGDRLTELL